jgi:flagellar biosynthesis protein FlhG
MDVVLAGHERHWLLALALYVVEKVLPGQLVHAEDLAAANVPALHAAHVVVPRDQPAAQDRRPVHGILVLQAAQRRLLALADLALIVATEEPTSLTDAYAVLKLLRQDRPAADARIIANMAGGAAGLRVWQVLDGAARNFLGAPVAFAGAVRRDGKVADAIRHQQPILLRHPTSQAAADIRALAGGLGV